MGIVRYARDGWVQSTPIDDATKAWFLSKALHMYTSLSLHLIHIYLNIYRGFINARSVRALLLLEKVNSNLVKG